VLWELDAASVKSLVGNTPAEASVTIEFEHGQVSGQSGCNTYGGGYRAHSDGTIELGPFHTTLMACESALATLEQAYLRALQKVTHFSVHGTLSLTGSSVTLTYLKQAEPSPVPLVGATWHLLSISTGGTASTSDQMHRVTLSLAPDGSMSGFAGCNNFHGTYEVSGAGLKFGPIAATMKACEHGAAALERAYLHALDQTSAYAIEGSTLSLRDASDRPLLQFSGGG